MKIKIAGNPVIASLSGGGGSVTHSRRGFQDCHFKLFATYNNRKLFCPKIEQLQAISAVKGTTSCKNFATSDTNVRKVFEQRTGEVEKVRNKSHNDRIEDINMEKDLNNTSLVGELGFAANRKCAFTLAEVLITLTVIGVVAALTLPTLIQKYQKTVYVNQLKQSVSILEQGFAKMRADSLQDYLFDTEVFNSIEGERCHTQNSPDSPICKEFFNNFKKYFKVDRIVLANDVNYKMKYIKKGSVPNYPAIESGGPSRLIVFENGMIITNYYFYNDYPGPSSRWGDARRYSCEQIKSLGGHICYRVGQVVIDVNGFKGPNIEGRDIFDFAISEYGKLIPFWSREISIYDTLTTTTKNWRYNNGACGTPGQADAETISNYGSGCAARIFDNNWVMDY